MTTREAQRNQEFGGQWTREKLAILERYLNAYTTALKSQPFQLMYIDAFAGTGEINTRADDPDAESFLKGSAQIAIDVGEKPFDKLVFVENDEDKYRELVRIQEEHPDRDIEVYRSDANDFLRDMRYNWQHWRGVLFLDPFATAVEWATIKAIAKTEALDTWILFPLSAVSRMLPRRMRPADIPKGWDDRLTRIFGDESWRTLYSPQPDLLATSEDDTLHARRKGGWGTLAIYKKNLKQLFGKRLLPESRTLMNSKNAPLFEFIFCVGNARGREIAFRIAKHLIEKLEVSYPSRGSTARPDAIL